jgi:RNA polymerase sigma factor (sigma-70 family)
MHVHVEMEQLELFDRDAPVAMNDGLRQTRRPRGVQLVRDVFVVLRLVRVGVRLPLTPAVPGLIATGAVAEHQDLRELLRIALGKLPATLRTAVILRDLQELSYQEIADRLGLPEGTVKSRINRGRLELARQLKRLQDKQPAARRRGERS